MTREDTLDLLRDKLMDLIRTSARVDERHYVRVSGGFLAKPLSDILKILNPTSFDTVSLTRISLRSKRRVEVEDSGPMGDAVASRQFACLSNRVCRNSSGDALIDDRGDLVAIAQNDLAEFKRTDESVH